MPDEKTNFQYILRLLNTNVDGKQKIMVALTQIKGVGRRYSNLVCKKADVDLTKRYVRRYIFYDCFWNILWVGDQKSSEGRELKE